MFRRYSSEAIIVAVSDRLVREHDADEMKDHGWSNVST